MGDKALRHEVSRAPPHGTTIMKNWLLLSLCLAVAASQMEASEAAGSYDASTPWQLRNTVETPDAAELFYADNNFPPMETPDASVPAMMEAPEAEFDRDSPFDDDSTADDKASDSLEDPEVMRETAEERSMEDMGGDDNEIPEQVDLMSVHKSRSKASARRSAARSFERKFGINKSGKASARRSAARSFERKFHVKKLGKSHRSSKKDGKANDAKKTHGQKTEKVVPKEKKKERTSDARRMQKG